MSTLSSQGYEVSWLGQHSNVILTGAIATLEAKLGARLHEYTAIDEAVHTQASAIVSDTCRKIIWEEKLYFYRTMGRDLHIQTKPYLRISRPGEPTDNIGLHRDTWYGDTPYEVSVWIPFTDTDAGNALRVAPGSHLWDERKHPTEAYEVGIEKGSAKHALGFAYAPKRLKSPVKTIPVTMKVGQMLVFPVSLLHGVEMNTSARTRISMDCRVANSLAPIAFSRSRDKNYYSRMSVSPITEVALKYAEANA